VIDGTQKESKVDEAHVFFKWCVLCEMQEGIYGILFLGEAYI